MAKTSGGVRRTGGGFTTAIAGPTIPSSKATEIQYVFVDKTTGSYSNGYASAQAAKNAIRRAERSDKDAGIYEPNNYYIERIEQLKGRGRSEKYWEG